MSEHNKIFKDFEGDDLDISVTSVVFIDASKSSLVYSHTEAKKMANWLLNIIEEKEKQGITIEKL